MWFCSWYGLCPLWLDQTIHVLVKITLTGTPEGVTLGGLLDQQLREIEVSCMANAIPDEITMTVDHLELGDSIHIYDLPLPAGVEATGEGDQPVATVMIPRGLTEEEEAGVVAEGAEGEEGEGEGAEGEAAEGDDDAKAEEASSEKS